MNFTLILLAAGCIVGIGLLCALLLVLADRFFHVDEDEKYLKLRECLPGANCGACGYSGCDSYAKALANDDTVATNLCIPGADATAKQIAEVLGKEALDVVEMVAYAGCDGNCRVTDTKYDYQGLHTCAAVKLQYGGNGLCTWGCIGFGDCATVCPNQAICIEGGIAHIDTRKCTGCGLCAKHCPQHLIRLLPDVERVIVVCNNHEKGGLTRKHCTHGCIGCKKCEKNCPVGAIAVVDNLAVIDYDKCIECKKCAEDCPTGCIMVADLSGIHRQRG